MPRKTVQDNIDISINIDGGGEGFINHDTLTGLVQLKSFQDFENLHLFLTFEGSSFTCSKNTDGIHTHLGRVIGKHHFLAMPVHVENLPLAITAGQNSTVPFHFEIPGHLPYSCNHSINDIELQAQHGVMPPSMVLNRRVILEDGVTVDAAKITYGIRADLRLGDVRIGQTFKAVKFISSSRHPMRLLHTILCGEIMFKNDVTASRGASKLVVENENPVTISLPPPGLQQGSILGKVDLLLRYESSESTATPIVVSKLGIVLKAITYYNARPFRNQPSILDSTSKGYRYLEENVATYAFALGKIDWERQDLENAQVVERMSLHPSLAMISPLSAVFTSTVSVPVTVAANDIYTKFLPTFDTCIISRSYFAELDFSFAHAKSPTSSCRVPVLVKTTAGGELSSPDLSSVSDQQFARQASPPDYSEHLLDDLPAYEPHDIRLVQNDGLVETFAYVKSEPWLNVHNGFKHGYKKLKGHLELRQARSARNK